MRSGETINSAASGKGSFRAFKNVAGAIARRLMIDRPALDDHGLLVVRAKHDNLLGVAKDRDIRIVGHDDDLAMLLG